MHSFRPMWLMRHASILTAVVVLTVGAANAQFARSADSSSTVAVSASESSSASDSMPAVDGGDGLAALPAAPAPAAGGSGAAGRQNGGYDTHSGGGFFSRMTWEGGGGFNAPAGDDITWGANFT